MSGSEQNEHIQTVETTTDLSIATLVDPTNLRAKMTRMKEVIELKRLFLKENLHEGADKDYAVIQGCGKRPMLLKPGAEKLLDWHGYYPAFELVAQKEDDDLGIYSYVYRCTIKQRGSNMVIAQCEGDASTMESKYRFEWKTADQLPAGTMVDTLESKKDDYGKIRYRVLVAHPADKRNTVRKMAQKRALIGATVLATATSDLFATEEPPDGGGDSGGGGNEGKQGQPTGDYGDPISGPQANRLHVIRKKANISEAQLLAWLKAKYGITKIEAIGWKLYKEICTAVENQRLDMPEPEKPVDEKPTTNATSPNSLIAEIDELEAKLGGNPGEHRQAKTGSTDLSTRTETQLRNYLDWLKTQVKA